jgi:hypothetical protein
MSISIERVRIVAFFALIGAVSGAVGYFLVGGAVGIFGGGFFHAKGGVSLPNPTFVLPGLVFGLIVGFFLRRRGQAAPSRYWGFVATSTISYFAAWTAGGQIVDAVDDLLVTVLAAFLLGAALQMAFCSWLFRFFRRPVPCVLMLCAGCLPAAILGVVELLGVDSDALSLIVVLALWQPGYAASLATALPLKAGRTG